jgi:uncharacterized protein
LSGKALAAAAPEERIESIDAIRGIALFGVLMVNLMTEFRVSIFAQFLPTGTNGLVERAVVIALEQKAFCLFSLLFGVGLAMQFERLSATGRPLYWLCRRLAVLLVLGLLHLLMVWNGDILTEYAIAGAVVLPLLLLPQAGLLIAAAVFLFAYLLGSVVIYSLPWPDAAALRAHVESANQVYSTGSVAQVWRFSWQELPLIAVLHAWVFPRTIALFLLGAFFWRAGLLRRAREYMDEIALAAALGIVGGAAMTAARVGGGWGLLAPIILALGYGAGLLALAQWPGGRKLLAPFAPVGRMAFTNYLMQSVVFGLVFFGYGFGQFGRMSAAMAFALGVAVYAAQIAISKWWLARYRFGPVEWLWRVVMYGTAQPMRGL